MSMLGTTFRLLMCFLQRLFASMTSFGTCLFWASEVEPLRSERRTLYYSSIFTFAGRMAGNLVWTGLKMS